MQLTPLPYPIRYSQQEWLDNGDNGWDYAAALALDEPDGDDHQAISFLNFYGGTFCPDRERGPIVEAFIGDEWVRVIGSQH